MDRKTFIRQVRAKYGTAPDFPWEKYPDYATFRHPDNRKWFCLLMPLPSGMPEEHGDGHRIIDVINVKVQPESVAALQAEPGIFPAWYMNKKHWVSVVLADVPEKRIWQLVDDSHQLTAG